MIPSHPASREARRLDERGIALLTVLLVAFAISAIALGAVMMTLNANLVGKNDERAAILDAVAIAGLEEGRSRLNGNPSLYPLTGFVTLEDHVPVSDALGAPIPKVTRSVYAGPSGLLSSTNGLDGSILAVAQDSFGNQVVRRLEITQQSFAKFELFDNSEHDSLGAVVNFQNGDVYQGPVFSNDTLHIASTHATFNSSVLTAQPAMVGASYGTFSQPVQFGVARIPMPTATNLDRLDTLAQAASMAFAGSTAGAQGEALTRIQFLTIDVGGGNFEGFFRVYQGNDPAFVAASLPPGNLIQSPNCGDSLWDGAAWNFRTALAHDGSSPHSHSVSTALSGAGRRCYLGGDSVLTNGGAGGSSWLTTGHADGGQWMQAPAAITATLSGTPALAGRTDLSYLFPLSTTRYPSFHGVIFVRGNVVVSGVVHGRVTLGASGNIVVGDDLTYYENPATRNCATGDILGLFSQHDVVIANNTLNAPQTVNSQASVEPPSSASFKTFDDTRDERLHGFVIALGTFGPGGVDLGASTSQSCTTGGFTWVGRGCLITFGGVIEGHRASIMGPAYGFGHAGYALRAQYDACGADYPPPFFPNSGVFSRGAFFELNPIHFNAANWFAANQH
jgi:hypothetical protein